LRLTLAAALVSVAAACGTDPSSTNVDAGNLEGGADGDGDSDADEDCPGYPSPPHGWNLDEPLSLTSFPAVHGPDGAPTELDVCEIFADHESVKALVFAIGASS